MSYDIIIRNGKVITGSGGPWIYADIGIKDGVIVKIGYLGKAMAEKVIDATGKFVTPGFIDMHNHSDHHILVYPTAESALMQGVTTIVIGNCGLSAAPVSPKTIDLYKSYWAQIAHGLTIEPTWKTLEEYVEVVKRAKPAINIVPLIGHGTVRLAVMGFESRAPTTEELDEMKKLVRESMEAGAFGMSLGLIYPPGSFASTDEIIELAKVVAEYKGLCTFHIRGESYNLINAVKEAIEVGEKAGVAIEISHHKAAGRDNWGKVKETLKMMEEARRIGIDVTCDVYPYTAGMTMLSATLPRWVHEGGVERLLERLKDPETRKKIIDFIEKEVTTWENFIKLAGWEGIVISYSKKCKECEGKSIAEICRAKGKDPYETLFDILIQDEAKTTMIIHLMSEDDVITVIKHPLSIIGSDSWITPAEGKPHPRFFGTFPRIIKRYVKELGVLRLEEAIMKMTAMPAQKVKLSDRGLIAPGFKADIVVFDYEKIEDKATFEEPAVYPTGIEYVLVNGAIAVEEGRPTGIRAGQVLKRS